MNITDLEKKMRAAFRREKSAVDTDELWDSIQAGLPPADQKKAYLTWSRWLPLLLLLIGFGGYFLVSNIESEVVVDENSESYSVNLNEPKASKNDNITSPESSNNQNLIRERNENVNINSESLSDQEFSTDRNSSDQSISANQESKSSSDFQKTETTKNELKSQPRNSSFSYSPARNDGQNVNLTEEAGITEGSRQSSTSRSYSASPLSLTDDNYTSSTTRDQNINDSGINQSNTQSTDGRLFTSNNDNSPSSIVQRSEDLALSTALLEFVNIDRLERDYNQLKNPVLSEQRPFWIKRDKRLYIDIGASLFAGHGSLSLNNPEFDTQFANRNSAEKGLISYGFDAKIGYFISDEVSVYTGLALNRLFKSSAASITSVENITVQDGLIQEIIGMNNTQEIRGEVSGMRQTSSSVRRINSYNFIHIPIGVLWKRSLGLIDLRIGAEARIGMTANYKGFIHPSTTAEYNLSDDTDKIFSDSAPHFILGSAGISYPFSDIMSIGVDANYQYQLGNIYKDTYGIEEKLSGIGLRTGIQIKI